MKFVRERDHGQCGGEAATVANLLHKKEELERDQHTREYIGKTNLHSNYVGKQEELDFVSSSKQQSLKPGILYSVGFTGTEPQTLGLLLEKRTLGLLLEERKGKQPEAIKHGNRNLKYTWGTQWGDYSFISEHVPKRQHSRRDSSRNKGIGQCHLPPHPLA